MQRTQNHRITESSCDFHLQRYPVLQDQVHDKIKFYTVHSLRNEIILQCIV